MPEGLQPRGGDAVSDMKRGLPLGQEDWEDDEFLLAPEPTTPARLVEVERDYKIKKLKGLTNPQFRSGGSRRTDGVPPGISEGTQSMAGDPLERLLAKEEEGEGVDEEIKLAGAWSEYRDEGGESEQENESDYEDGEVGVKVGLRKDAGIVKTGEGSPLHSVAEKRQALSRERGGAQRGKR